MDRGRVGDQGSHDRVNENATGGGKRGQTRKTWRPCGLGGCGSDNYGMRESCQQTKV